MFLHLSSLLKVFQDASRANAAAVSQFDTAFSVVRATRSLAGKYNIQSGIQCKLLKFSNIFFGSWLINMEPAFVQSSDTAERESLTSQIPTMTSLIKGSQSMQTTSSIQEVPSGCVSEVVSGSLVVHLLVKV